VTIDFRTSGGVAYLPGLAAPVTIETGQLPADRREELERLVHDARFFERPAQSPPPAKGADYTTYTITIKDGAREHTVRLVDPISDPALQALVEALRVEARSQRRAAR
jgi:hypothetical protein